jgi:hypothetical protein
MSEILYRPDLDYKKDYSTTANITQTDTQTVAPGTTTEPDAATKINDIKDDADAIKDVVSTLPDDFQKAVKPILETVIVVLDSIDPDKYPVDPIGTIIETTVDPSTVDPNPITNPVDPTKGEMPELPDDIFPNLPDIDTVVVKTGEDKDPFVRDLVDVIDDYIANLKQKVNQFIQKIIMSTGTTTISELQKYYNPYTGSAAQMKNKNLKHISDIVVRSQIIRGQKVRLMNKLFDENQTLMHIQSCKVANELKNRYDDEEYVEESDYNSFVRNIALSDSRSSYSKKYKENFYNLYKYLNSSVILFNECLDLLSSEIQAKVIIEKDNK